MDNISDKIDLALKVVSAGCCVTALALAYKNLKDLKSLEDNSTASDEQEKYIFDQINDTDIQNESDQTNN